jgi:hypothetical protein
MRLLDVLVGRDRDRAIIEELILPHAQSSTELRNIKELSRKIYYCRSSQDLGLDRAA